MLTKYLLVLSIRTQTRLCHHLGGRTKQSKTPKKIVHELLRLFVNRPTRDSNPQPSDFSEVPSLKVRRSDLKFFFFLRNFLFLKGCVVELTIELAGLQQIVGVQ